MIAQSHPPRPARTQLHDILTVTLNPSLDLATAAATVWPGRKLRCEAPMLDPGGGGINVARTVHVLGGNAIAFVALAGPTGDRVLRLLLQEGVPVALFDGPGETRLSVAVTDRSSAEQYRFVLPGPDWNRSLANRVLGRIAGAVNPGGLVVLSGSQPPGLATDFAAELAARLVRRRARLVLDTSGAALAAAAARRDGRIEVLRMDQEEAEELAGRPLATRADSAGFAQSLVASGAARAVIVARGADGSTLATAELRLHADGVPVEVKSKIGAGDSFLAAFTLAVSRGQDLGEALSRGSAAAAAATMTEATQLCRRRDAERLVPLARLSEV